MKQSIEMEVDRNGRGILQPDAKGNFAEHTIATCAEMIGKPEAALRFSFQGEVDVSSLGRPMEIVHEWIERMPGRILIWELPRVTIRRPRSLH